MRSRWFGLSLRSEHRHEEVEELPGVCGVICAPRRLVQRRLQRLRHPLGQPAGWDARDTLEALEALHHGTLDGGVGRAFEKCHDAAASARAAAAVA